MPLSLNVADSYAVRARSRLESNCWICASSCRASACLAPMEGSLVAAPAAKPAAARARMMIGACRFRTLTTSPDVHPERPHGPPARHKVRTLPGCSDAGNRQMPQKLPQIGTCSLQIGQERPRTNSPNRSWTVVRSRDGERPKDTIRGAARRHLGGARARCRLCGGRRRPRAERAGPPRPGELARLEGAERVARSLRARLAAHRGPLSARLLCRRPRRGFGCSSRRLRRRLRPHGTRSQCRRSISARTYGALVRGRRSGPDRSDTRRAVAQRSGDDARQPEARRRSEQSVRARVERRRAAARRASLAARNAPRANRRSRAIRTAGRRLPSRRRRRTASRSSRDCARSARSRRRRSSRSRRASGWPRRSRRR